MRRLTSLAPPCHAAPALPCPPAAAPGDLKAIAKDAAALLEALDGAGPGAAVGAGATAAAGSAVEIKTEPQQAEQQEEEEKESLLELLLGSDAAADLAPPSPPAVPALPQPAAAGQASCVDVVPIWVRSNPGAWLAGPSNYRN